MVREVVNEHAKTYRLSETDVKRIEALAKKLECSFTDVVKQAVREKAIKEGVEK